MPRDKKESHDKITAAAMEEFLDKGFEKASIRGIAARAGLTSAALYRHFDSKEAMFAALAEPAIQALDRWQTRHADEAYRGVETQSMEYVSSRSEVDMMREVVMPNRDAFRLILCCSQGTRYENFIHDLVERQQKELLFGIHWLKQKGFPVTVLSEEDIHMLLSAYLTALFEPVIHNFPAEDTEAHLQLVEKFFMPGWHEVLGI